MHVSIISIIKNKKNTFILLFFSTLQIKTYEFFLYTWKNIHSSANVASLDIIDVVDVSRVVVTLYYY